MQRLAGLTGVHFARLHVPGADLAATPPTCAVIVHIPAHGNPVVWHSQHVNLCVTYAHGVWIVFAAGCFAICESLS